MIDGKTECDLENKNDSPVTDKKITTSQANLLIELINEESNLIAEYFSLLILNFCSISNINSIGSKEKSLDKTLPII